MITADWQFSYAGLLLGDTTIYGWTSDNLTDLPNVRTSRQPRLRQDGQHPGDSFLDGRMIRLIFELDGGSPTGDPAAMNAAVQQVSEAFQPAGEKPLHIRKPGFAGGREVFINCEPVRLSVPGDLEFFYGLPIVTVELEASDPLYHDTNVQSVTGLQLGAGVGGLTWPLTWPLTWGSFTSGAFTAVNNGSRSAAPTVTFRGPLTNPKIENQTTGRTLEFQIVLAGGETLVVDVAARTVLFGGTANRYSTLTAGSEWFRFSPGGDQIRFAAAAGTGTMDVQWASAWA